MFRFSKIEKSTKSLHPTAQAWRQKIISAAELLQMEKTLKH